MRIDQNLTLQDLESKLESFWQLAKEKVEDIKNNYDDSQGSPVFTAAGKYTTKGWTEWTQGFQYGIPLFVHEVLGDKEALKGAKDDVVRIMAPHLSHFGVHDHGFNNLSTYGNLLRQLNEGSLQDNEWERNFYELALSMSGSVQAKRYVEVQDGGYLYSFNGPHSLFIDTIRTARILNVAHILGHRMLDEHDGQVNFYERAITHAKTTAKYAVFYGEGRDGYDERGRVAHESIFNLNDGHYRCPNSQQGFSGFTTWTRGLSWAMLGFPEFLEFERDHIGTNKENEALFLKAAEATCDFFIEKATCIDGIPYWDTGAPQIHKLGDYQNEPSNPYNDYEPIDSSAAAIGAQGLLRLGNYLKNTDPEKSKKYIQAGLTVTKTLLEEPYLATDKNHQGILLHSIYHEPNKWDYVPEGSKVSHSEASMWGDYHMVELCYFLWKQLKDDSYYTFYKSLTK